MFIKNQERKKEKDVRREQSQELRNRLHAQTNQIYDLFGQKYEPTVHNTNNPEASYSAIKQRTINTPKFEGTVLFKEYYDAGINPEADSGPEKRLFVLGQSGDRVVTYEDSNTRLVDPLEIMRIELEGDLISESLEAIIEEMTAQNSQNN